MTRERCELGVDGQRRKAKKGGTNEFHDLDEHPVVLRLREDIEQLGSQRKVVLGVLASEFGENVDGGGDDAWRTKETKSNELKEGEEREEGKERAMLTLILVLQTIAQTREVVLESFGILFEHSIHAEDSSFTDLLR